MSSGPAQEMFKSWAPEKKNLIAGELRIGLVPFLALYWGRGREYLGYRVWGLRVGGVEKKMEITALLRAWFCGPSFLCGNMKGVDAAVSLLRGISTGVRGCGGKLGRHRSQEI